MIITALHTDLRGQPIPHTGKELDRLQESQLLYGEPVKVHYGRGEWLYVEALEQLRGEGGYGGWVAADAVGEGPTPNATVTTLRAIVSREPGGIPCGRLFIGSRVCVVGREGGYARILYRGEERFIREATLKKEGRLEMARAWLGSPYVWGGLLPPGMGIDCSGLVHLAFRGEGLVIPRNSIDQYRGCTPCTAEELVPGDLLFASQRGPDPRTISHVMFYEEGEGLLEATILVKLTRRVTAKERFGINLRELRNGENYRGLFLFFGKWNSEPLTS
ncbi:MAG: NlpC/P60 family protein [Parachlamydiales bacterium]